MFSMAVWRGTVAGPCIGGRGGKLAVLARPIALNAYFCQENCPLVNYPNETMSSYPSPPRSTQSDSQFKGPLSTSELLRPDVADKSMSGEEPVDREKPNRGSPFGEIGQ